MNTLNKKAKNAFFEVEVSDKAGQVCWFKIFFLNKIFIFKSVVYTSTTNKKPSSYSSRCLARRTATGKIYTTYVPASAKNFYFTVKGLKSNANKYNFVVRVRPLDF
jgi:hypothetical protein